MNGTLQAEDRCESKRRYGRKIPIYPVYSLRYQTGMRNSASCKTRSASMRIRSRIERLEDELLPLSAGTPIKLNILAVKPDGKTVLAQVFEVPVSVPSQRRWRTTRWPRTRWVS